LPTSAIVDRRSTLEEGGMALSLLLLSPIVMMHQQPAYAADFDALDSAAANGVYRREESEAPRLWLQNGH